MGEVVNLFEECEKRGKRAYIEPDPLLERRFRWMPLVMLVGRIGLFLCALLIVGYLVLMFLWYTTLGFVLLYSSFGWILYVPIVMITILYVTRPRKKERPAVHVVSAEPRQITYVRGAKLYLAFDRSESNDFDGPKPAA